MAIFQAKSVRRSNSLGAYRKAAPVDRAACTWQHTFHQLCSLTVQTIR